ncbi:AMP-dependent synthetase and ligase [Cupriavidus necator]|uniref:AMP-dependent synthetase and ligase n=2 Tax=Cupriavidus necator TaxID=106590 RepID=A0A1K0IH79_CUPNE|nr:AMP-dependent synthetase and ligase [Cupriavidus necator]
MFVPSGRRVTYRELEDGANRVANLLRQAGVRNGDSVLFSVENCPEFLYLGWGCQRAGAVFTPASTKLSAEDLCYIASDCGARLVVVSVASVGSGKLAASDFGSIPCFALGGTMAGFQRLEDALLSCPSEPIPDPARGREMMYSSGSTGRPKGVRKPIPPIPYDAIDPRDAAYERQPGVGPSMVSLCTSPLYHAAPHRNVAATLAMGGTAVVMERFDAVAALSAIEQFRVTHSVWVPTMFQRLLRLDPAVRGQFDLSSHRVALHGAAPCPVETKQAMINWWGPILQEYYAGTEGIGACSISSEEWLAHKGSVGRATDGVAHILDENEDELPPGVTGTVFFEIGSSFAYWNDAEKTTASRSKQGWWTYGDIGHLDSDGYLYLSDRRDFTIISGGVNIYPQEIEQVLLTDPRVLDVAVFGVPDDEYGESVYAVVHVERAPAQPDVLATDLGLICRNKLGPVRVPKSFSFVTDFPRLPTGKLQKKALQESVIDSLKVARGIS